MNIGNAIKLCRTSKGMSLESVAKLADFSASYVSLIEAGKRDPSVKVIDALARAMKIPTPILVFLAADSSEVRGLDSLDLERLSALAVRALRESNG